MTTFTKNRQTGSYDIIGLAGTLTAGQTATVTKKDGTTKTVTVGRVSKSFTAKFGPHKGKQCVIATVAGSSNRNGYTPAVRNSRGYVEQRGHYDGFCGYDCPVSGRKCCPANGPCHDCM